MKNVTVKKKEIKKTFNEEEIISKKPCSLMRIGKNLDTFLLLWTSFLGKKATSAPNDRSETDFAYLFLYNFFLKRLI